MAKRTRVKKAMNIDITGESRMIPENELIEMYQCSDGTWRLSYFPFADKDRNLTKEEALNLYPVRLAEAIDCYEHYEKSA